MHHSMLARQFAWHEKESNASFCRANGRCIAQQRIQVNGDNKLCFEHAAASNLIEPVVERSKTGRLGLFQDAHLSLLPFPPAFLPERHIFMASQAPGHPQANTKIDPQGYQSDAIGEAVK